MRTLRPCLAVAVVAAAFPAGASASSDASAAAVRDCNTRVSETTYISSVRNMRCRAARRDLRAYRGSYRRHFVTPGGFHCRRVSGGSLGGQWRCVKGGKAYRFEFGD